MLRIVVDSGSSIKQAEKEQYQIDILPIRIQIEGKEYLDDVNLDIDTFYEKLVEGYTAQGDDVLIITISSEISGTYNVLKMLFEENDKVWVFDSRLAVGGIGNLSASKVRRCYGNPFGNEIHKFKQSGTAMNENVVAVLFRLSEKKPMELQQKN